MFVIVKQYQKSYTGVYPGVAPGDSYIELRFLQSAMFIEILCQILMKEVLVFQCSLKQGFKSILIQAVCSTDAQNFPLITASPSRTSTKW